MFHVKRLEYGLKSALQWLMRHFYPAIALLLSCACDRLGGQEFDEAPPLSAPQDIQPPAQIVAQPPQERSGSFLFPALMGWMMGRSSSPQAAPAAPQSMVPAAAPGLVPMAPVAAPPPAAAPPAAEPAKPQPAVQRPAYVPTQRVQPRPTYRTRSPGMSRPSGGGRSGGGRSGR